MTGSLAEFDPAVVQALGEVRALSVREPWASAIAWAAVEPTAKLVENRSQGFPKNYRGLLLIHASLGWSARGRVDRRLLRLWPADTPHGEALRHGSAVRGRPPAPFESGAVIAAADCVDIHEAAGCCKPWGEDTYPPANPEQRPPGVVTHLVLANVRRFPPIAARGRLGLWRPDDDLLFEVALRLGVAA